MSAPRAFGYAQARLQARHARRPDAAAWRRMGAAGDVVQLLQVVRATSLEPWVKPLHADTDAHAIERWLRDQLTAYVRTVSAWQPPPWRAAVRWAARLVDLPALAHLLAGRPAAPWMRDDPALAGFLADDPALRLAAVRASDCAPLAAAHEADEPLLEGWIAHWRRCWANPDRGQSRALEGFAVVLRAHVAGMHGAPDAGFAARVDEALEQRLVAGFRRHLLEPVSVYYHLALVTVDLARLRGELVRRRLLGAPGKATA